MTEKTEKPRKGYNDDLDAQQRLYDSDYAPGAGAYGGRTLAGKDPVELARKWGGNPGGGLRKKTDPADGVDADDRD